MLNKSIVPLILLCLLALSLILFSAHPVVAGQVNAFIYHRFDEEKYPSTNIASQIFKQQLEYLKTNEIEVIGLEEVAQRLHRGDDLPHHAVALSVDDGYQSFYDIALPIIEEFGYPVSLFVNTDAVGKRGYMSWAQLKDAQDRGVTIANHTASHPYMVESLEGETRQQWQRRIYQDVETAQQALETHLDKTIDMFVYPYGEYSPEVVELIKGMGFMAAFAQQSGVIYEGSNRFLLPRFPMGGPFATLSGFVSKINMRPMAASIGSGTTPVVTDNPPALLLNIQGMGSHNGVNCFVQGDNSCQLEPAPDRGNDWYRVVAAKPLTGRRNKYTLTRRNANGQWLWFSHLWINANRPLRD